MALQKEDLVSAGLVRGALPRLVADGEKSKKSVPFEAVAGGATYEAATPVTIDASGIASAWVDGEAIDGFVWFDRITVNDSGSSTDEVLGVVVLAGEVHADDIVVLAGNTPAALATALRAPAFRNKGWFVQGLANWPQN